MGKIYFITPGIEENVYQEQKQQPKRRWFPDFNYIDILLRFYSSFLKVMPYTCIWDKEENMFYLESSIFKKILAAFLHLLAIVPSIKWVTEPFSDLQRNAGDVIVFFQVFDHFSSVILLIYMVYFVWRRMQLFVKFVNLLFRRFDLAELREIRKYSVFMMLFIGNLVTYRLIGSRGLERSLWKGEYSAEIVLKILYNFGANNGQDDYGCWPFYLSCLYYGIKYGITVGTLIVLPLYMLQHGLILCCLLGLRLVWRNLKGEIQRPGLSFERMVIKYSEIRRILNGFNELFTIPLLFIYFTNLTFISESLKNVRCACTSFQSLVEKVDAALYLVYTVMIWWISSKIHDEIQTTMREWVYSFHHGSKGIYLEKGKIPKLTIEERVKLLSFMAEVESDGLGVSCKFFTISYSTCSSMVGLIVTYGIVVHQFSFNS